MRKKLLGLLMVGLLLPCMAWAQQKVTGKISNESGDPLPGVSVLEAGTANGTLTDGEGNFSLVVSPGATLEVTLFGYSKQEIEVGERTSLTVTMTEGIVLDDVVITALGIEKEERALGYTVQSVAGDAVAKSSEPNILNALNGKIAGLQIQQPNGVAGGTTRITLRGNNSLVNGANQPLIIVDGVQIENSITGPGATSWTGQEAGRDWGSGINNINAWDIEDITVLKGPNAAALYGSRGSNGVIVITTKTGKKRQGIGIDFNTSLIATEAAEFRDVQNVFGEGSAGLNAQQFEQDDQGRNLLPPVGFWGSGASWGPKMEGQPVVWWNGEVLPFDPQPDNVKSFFQTGSAESYNVAFSGASEKGSLRASLTRTETTPITPNTERIQNTINLNTVLNVTDRLKAKAAISYVNSEAQNSPVLGNSESSIGKNVSWNWGRSYRPELEANNYVNPDGTRTEPGVGFPRNNALGRGRGRAGSFFWNLYQNNEIRQRDRLLGSLGLTLEIFPWLHAEGRLGLDSYNDNNESRNTPVDAEGLVGGRYSHTLARNRIQNHVFMLRSNNDISEDLNVAVNLGAEHWNRDFYSIQGDNGGLNFSDPFLYTFRNSDIGTRNGNDIFNRFRPGESKYEKTINSVFGSVDIGYKDMLYLTLTGRNDWSSALPDANNSYFYPSASLGFVFTEALGLDSDVLSFGKIRLAYSNTANDTEPYQLLPTFSRGTFAGQPTASVRATIPPLTLEPQQNDSYDLGFDLRLFNGRANIDFTYYYISSTNQILSSPLPISSGFSSLRFNTGEVENRGVEFMVSVTPIQTRNFTWDVSFNFASNRNKVISLAEGAETLRLGGIFGGNGPSIEARPGEEYGTIMGWDYEYFDRNGNETIDASERVPENRIIDENGQWYEITPERQPVGNAVPDWTGGLINTITWKDFTLNAVLDIKQGGDVFFGSHAIGLGFGQAPETLEGRNAEYGGMPFTDGNGVARDFGVIKEGVYADGTPNDKVVPYYFKHLDVFTWGAGSGPVSASVFEASWIRVRELSLTYQLPANLTQRLGFLNKLSITALGRNLWYLRNTAPQNLDPAQTNGAGNAQGMEWGQLPTTRSYGAVLNVGF